MSAKITETTCQQWPAIELSNEFLRTVIVPRLGAKVVSLRSERTGREWLWSNPHLPLAEPMFRGPYVEKFDSGGWDEMLPTIAPCDVPGTPWAGQALTDHGELWYRDWQVESKDVDEDGAGTVVMSVSGDPYPFKLRRILRLESDSATLSAQYELENTGDAPLPYIWAAHALVTIEPGMKLMFPDGTQVNCVDANGFELAEPGKPFEWPTLRMKSGNEVDLSVMPDPKDSKAAGFATMLFTEPLREGWVALNTSDGSEQFRFLFDKDHVPRVGVWQNRNRWSGSGSAPYFNMGIEPSTGPTGSLAEVHQAGTAHVLDAGQTREWVIVVSLE